MRKRKDSFFGLHFDFHADKNCKGLGDCSVELIDRMLSEVKPDFVQCDTKGHPGITSYPTKVGNPAPEMKGDLLKTWREVTAKHDVALYAHHSGVWDSEAISKNPDWAVIRSDGERSENITSVFGPYAEKLLVPQLIEIAKDYGLNGAWVDGECWATDADHSHWAVEKYKETYGKEPPKREDPDYPEYLEFCRNGFLEYVDRYMKEVHRTAPDFQLISNWLYTMYVVKKPEVDMDSISGDYDPNNSVNTARVDGRAIMTQQKPWDLMAWGFGRHGDSFFNKTTEQLCQEAAAVIMLGGGFQVFNRQIGDYSPENPDGNVCGSIQEFLLPELIELAKFCRAREDICFRAEALPQIGIVYSEKGHNSSIGGLFSLSGKHYDSVKGTTLAVSDCGIPSEILMTHRLLESDISKYGLIILPELPAIEPRLKEKLLQYAEKGGKLLITGKNATEIFGGELGTTVKKTYDKAIINLCYEGFRTTVQTDLSLVDFPADSRVLGEMFSFKDENCTAATTPVAMARKYGEGEIAGVYFNIGEYKYWRAPSFKKFIGRIIRALYTPSVRIISESNVDVSLMKKNGLLCVNLLNLNGEHADTTVCGFDNIPALRDVELEIDFGERPQSVRLEPEGIDLDYKWEDGVIRVRVDRIDIHSVITVK